MISAQESGVGGFLLFFVVTVVVNLVLALFKIPSFVAALTGKSGAFITSIYPAYPFLVGVQCFLTLGRVVFFIIGLVLIFRRDRRAPLFFVVFLAAHIVVALADRYVVARIYDALHAYLVQQGRSTEEVDRVSLKARWENIGSALYGVAWLLYWRSSERVRLTFRPGSGMTEIPTQS
jgi:hypothetical protein